MRHDGFILSSFFNVFADIDLAVPGLASHYILNMTPELIKSILHVSDVSIYTNRNSKIANISIHDQFLKSLRYRKRNGRPESSAPGYTFLSVLVSTSTQPAVVL